MLGEVRQGQLRQPLLLLLELPFRHRQLLLVVLRALLLDCGRAAVDGRGRVRLLSPSFMSVTKAFRAEEAAVAYPIPAR